MKTQTKMTAKQTEVLTLKLTALSVIADRLFDNKDIELFKKESLQFKKGNSFGAVLNNYQELKTGFVQQFESSFTIIELFGSFYGGKAAASVKALRHAEAMTKTFPD